MKKNKLKLRKVYLSNKKNYAIFKSLLKDSLSQYKSIFYYFLVSNLRKDNIEAIYLTDGDEIFGLAIYRYIGKTDHQYMHVLHHAILAPKDKEFYEEVLIEKLNNKVRKGLIISIEENQEIYPNFNVLNNHYFKLFNQKRSLITNCEFDEQTDFYPHIKKSYQFVFGNILTSVGYKETHNFP